MPAPLIELNGIVFRYPHGPEVFRDLRLALCAGERIGITGSNGSGKSTLLQLVVGLMRPEGGTIRLFGEAPAGEPGFVSARRRIGFLFQDSDDQLFCPTVLEDVAFGPLNQGHSQAAAHGIAAAKLEEMGLTHLAERVIYRLSGGEKRMVALAGVLAMSPEVLLLDEPTAGLDSAAVRRIESQLGMLNHEMIVVSHDNDFLERACNAIYVLHEGVLVRTV
ncbi:MAG: ABC transporter ATP-binding protein [Candidatus Hydrogenedentes bacterium]|nr:ABC transporter ATP-binding protein [Candidatus Hydrogenedentota bacterium]